jgi:predicted ribosomally synthesized peptide with SipW-like signal peptide
MSRRSALGPIVLVIVAAVLGATVLGGGSTTATLSDSESVGVSIQAATDAGNTGSSSGTTTTNAGNESDDGQASIHLTGVGGPAVSGEASAVSLPATAPRGGL